MSNDEQETSEYTVTINGIEHTMLLTEEDAKRYGDDAKKGGGDSSSSSATSSEGVAPSKAKAPENKSATASEK